jgi:hypothetical protein
MKWTDYEEFRAGKTRRDLHEKQGRANSAWDFSSSAAIRHANLGTWLERVQIALGVICLVGFLGYVVWQAL